MDALATVVTAVVIATSGAQQLHVPGAAPSTTSVDTQVRYLEASGQRLQYLTSKEGNAYHKERLQLECMRKLGHLAGRLCPK